VTVDPSTDSFPRQYARTRRLTLGEPRNLVVSPDGRRIVFIRSRAGDDPINCLYVLDVASGSERLIADPLTLLVQDDPDNIPAEEQARRERMRETASGVTTFATDTSVSVVAFPLAGRLYVAGLISGVARELVVDGPVFDPRPDPAASRLAYVCGSALRIAELDGSSWELASDDDLNVSWGSADYIAGEELHRFRGYWWSPDGTAIAACRVDDSPVQQWYISDPGSPDQQPREVRYPAAGTANANVELHVLALNGGTIEVAWDHDRFPYLTAVHWVSNDRLLLAVQSRDQRDLHVLEANPTTGDTAAIFEDHDDRWVELVPGTPNELDDGRLVMTADRDGMRRLMIGGQAVTPTDLQVRSVGAARGNVVVFHANHPDDATVQHVWQWSDDGLTQISDGAGIHSAIVGGDTTVLRSTSLDSCAVVTAVVGGPVLESFAEEPIIDPNL
jgi:dipeptidyl-peptidase-4